MSLTQNVSASIGEAMRQRDQARLRALRMLKTALVNRGVEKGRDLEPAEEQQVVASLVKQRREAIEQFTKGGRADLVEKEAAEITVLEAYLPPPMDPDLVARIVSEAIAETGAASAKDTGRVMKAAMAKLAGQGADGRMVSDLVRKALGGA